MAIRDIITLPDPRLRLVCAPVKTVDERVRALADDMLETMYDAPGIGLAASQVGIMERIIVIDASRSDDERQPLRLINPEISWRSEEMSVYEEGCLSIPEYYEEVERASSCKVRFIDVTGKTRELDCDGLLATVVQHEVDHLNGILFIDHISKLKRDRVTKKFVKAKKREDVE